MREGLLAYVETMKRNAREDYKHEVLVYVSGGTKQPPKLPRILRND